MTPITDYLVVALLFAVALFAAVRLNLEYPVDAALWSIAGYAMGHLIGYRIRCRKLRNGT